MLLPGPDIAALQRWSWLYAEPFENGTASRMWRSHSISTKDACTSVFAGRFAADPEQDLRRARIQAGIGHGSRGTATANTRWGLTDKSPVTTVRWSMGTKPDGTSGRTTCCNSPTHHRGYARGLARRSLRAGQHRRRLPAMDQAVPRLLRATRAG